MIAPIASASQSTDLAPAIKAAADRLHTAAATREPCRPVRDVLGTTDLRSAYAVQQLLISRAVASGRTVVGRKIGLTSRAVQTQLGVGRPDYGALLDDMSCAENEPIDIGRLLQPKAEAEIAFVLGTDLTGEDITEHDVVAATAQVVAAIEIVDSRIRDWDIAITDTIADNASSGLFVLGAARVPLDGRDLAAVVMRLRKNGALASTGRGADCLGDPLTAVAWLATTLARLGEPLRAGDVVLSGALGPMVTVEPGTVIDVELSGLGQVSCSFAACRHPETAAP